MPPGDERGHRHPGEIVVGADSHTCTMGAFGLSPQGSGIRHGIDLGHRRDLVQGTETINIRLEGELPRYVEAKDVALRYVGLLGAEGLPTRQ